MKTYVKMPLSPKKLERIKILAFDLDDTLLDASGKLSEANRAAILRAMEKGYHVVIATGRVFSALAKDVIACPGIRYAVTSNGARITDLEKGEPIYENLLSEENVRSVFPWMEGEDIMLEIFCNGEVWASKDCLSHVEDFGVVTEKSRNYVLSTRKPADDIMQVVMDNIDRLENINILFGDQAKRLRYLAELKNVDGVTAVSSLPHNVEIGGPTTSKASGLAALAEMLDLSSENIMAFGDSSNDTDMILKAGIGVAMGNSVEEVLEAADYISLTNEDDGVAYALETLLGI